MPSETDCVPDDISYQRAYAALAAQAFQHTGHLSATALQALKLSAGPAVVDRLLLHFHNSDLFHLTDSHAGEIVYDFLPLLEKITAEFPAYQSGDRVAHCPIYQRLIIATAQIFLTALFSALLGKEIRV